MTVNEAFDKVFWLNSRQRADRYIRMKKRLNAENIEAERIEAIWGGSLNPNSYQEDSTKRLTLPEVGCFLSHRSIFERIKAEGWKRTLILEDDALFVPGFAQLFTDLYAMVPEDWDMLYLGRWNFKYYWDDDWRKGELIGLIEEIHPRVWKAEQCWYTHAYVIDQRCIDFLLENTQVLRKSIDGQLADLHEHLKVYAIHPAIIEQDESPSSIQIRL